MTKKAKTDLNDHIIPLNMNGLRGRMLYLPSPPKKKREILLIYGHHASIERMIGVAEDLNRYGSVTLPDLPGFGGMEAFYKIGEKPTLDNLADYLAALVKLRFNHRRLTIMGMSFGFLVVTRMLQKYPDLAKKVDLLISIVGFAHKDDFHFSRRQYLLLRTTATFFSNRLPAWVAKTFVFRGPFIRSTYLLVADRHIKLKDASKEERDRRINFEIGLWQANDIRTHMETSVSMLTVDLCNQRVDLPVYHVAVENDRYFNNKIVEQHMRVIFNDVHVIQSKIVGHAPTVVADAEAAAVFIPTKLRRLLAAS